MIGLHRTPRIRKVLAVGALIGLAGCQHAPSRPSTPSVLGMGNESSGRGATITAAQEADVQISLGRAAEQQGNLDQAMVAYRSAVDRDGRRADAYARMAILNDKQGKFRESAELYRKALALQPGSPDIFCDMGYSFYLQRRWAEAEINLRQSIAINPEHQRAHNNLALLLVRDSRLDDALAEFRKAGNTLVQAHMNMAFALTTDQRLESARSEYERALALDPSNQLAKARLDQLSALVAKQEPASRPKGDEGKPERLANESSPRRDPAVRVTAAVSQSPTQQYRPNARVAIPSLPANDDAMRRLWAAGDATPTPPPDLPATPTTTVAKPQNTQSQPGAAPLADSSVPLTAVRAPRLAPAKTQGPKPSSIPPPRSFQIPPTALPATKSTATPPPSVPPQRMATPRAASPGESLSSNPSSLVLDSAGISTIGP